jgi:hypothetical protein
MTTSVQDRDVAAVFGGLHALDGLVIAASAGGQYALARRR